MDKLIIANCSGFFGDRFSAAKEMITGGEIHVLTGDYLAELTMAILFRTKLQSPDKGYASTFLKQMEQILGECIDKKIRVVTNAGGLNPSGLVAELQKIAQTLGLRPIIACIEGDDLMPRLAELQTMGEQFTHLDKGISLKDAGAQPITANAYLGGWGITRALTEGADIVIGGRIADAALVSGPAAWKFGWTESDWDQLAGAYAAGHIIECGAQATGGNYSFLDEIPSFKNVGFPIAEMHADGSFVITKHPGTGGRVSIGTVTAQLLYEIREPAYLTPDVIAHFDTIDLREEATDRVFVQGVKGSPPTGSIKVCINNLFGYRNAMTVILTGLDIERKAQIVEKILFDSLGGKDRFAVADVQLIHSEKTDPATNDEAFAYLRISVLDPDPNKVGRLFSAKIVELALANIPGFTLTSPPANGMPAIQHWPALVDSRHIQQKVSLGEKIYRLDCVAPDAQYKTPPAPNVKIAAVPSGKTVNIPLGRIFATRSGDKGGNANLGVWATTDSGFTFLRQYLSVDRLKTLLSDVRPFVIERYELPNLRAVNFYIRGILGEGAAASVRSDPQAKTLGEYLRAKFIEVPEAIAHIE